MMTDLINSLEALAGKVTPGDWEATVRSGYHEVLAPRPGTNWYGRLDRQAVFYGDTELFDDENAANAALIVTLRNALPAIIAALKVAELVRDEDWLAEALARLLPRMGQADHLPDDAVIPVDMTMAEIRQARAALALARGGA